MSSGPESVAGALDTASEWQRIELGWLESDLPVWRRLAEEFPGPVLEMGSGAGRVSLDLGAAGHRVVGVERSEDLSSYLRSKALNGGLDVSVLTACVGKLEPVWRNARDSGEVPETVGLVIAPMQFANLLTELQRVAALEFIASGEIGRPVLALAVLAEPPSTERGSWVPSNLPDLADRSGTILSSRITELSWQTDRFTITRERNVVAQDGALSTTCTCEEVTWVPAEDISAQLAGFGYRLDRDEMLPPEAGSMDSRLLVYRYGGQR